jgi:hypothetical protein
MGTEWAKTKITFPRTDVQFARAEEALFFTHGTGARGEHYCD